METYGAGKKTEGGAAGSTTAGGEQNKDPKKTSWPELVGKPVEEAREAILRDMPYAHIVVVPVGTPVTMDYKIGRVRIFVSGPTVAQVPKIG